jgi:hypothetical protein
MPVTRAIERNSLTFPESSHKNYSIPSRISTQYEENHGNNSASARISHRRVSDSAKKSNVPSKHPQSTSPLGLSHTQTSRRSSSDGNKQSTVSGSPNERFLYQQRQLTPPPKPKCLLPTTVCQPGYVTPSKLFNIMGYGLQNQYLFMHAHYLYIIDCRSREKFDESHIITGKNFIRYH